ncbi:hypothetical protein ACSTS3_15300 [Aquimarina muelleri]|uniref:hypothetical protein n=1 Tax=Aquimarina muelleri TaxID=279356 RepID=UPI003F688B9B
MDKRSNLIGYPIVIIITAIITFLLLKKCEKPDPPTVDPPKEIISFKDAIELYRTYTNNRSCVIEVFESKRDSSLTNLCPSKRKPIANFVPSRSFHLNKEFLNQYMAYINQVTPDSIAVTGYRLYLGNYPDTTNLSSGKPVPDPRRNTFFIAPTTLLGNSSTHRGFTFVDQNNDGKPEVLFLEDELDNLKNPNPSSPKTKINTANFFSFSSQNGGTSTIANDLGGSPPF